LNPYAGGGFDISYISYKTLFGKFDPNRVSQTFLNFEEYRQTISERWGKINQNSNGVSQGYANGYNQYASDVLIPAFIAAYTGKDPSSIHLIDESNPNVKSNPFKGYLPEPNWKIDYNGLSKVKPLDKIFSSLTISHGYTGDLSMNGFTSALLYLGDINGMPNFYDTISKNFIPYFLVPNITIQEQFAPLIGLDMTFINKMQAKFEYAKQRTLSLSLVDYQLSETRSTSFTIGAGYKKKGMKLPFIKHLPPFLSKKGSSKIDNEMDFRLDYKLQDNVTANSQLDQNNNYATSGSREITLSPTIDYYLNSKVNIKLYYDRRRVIPYVSSSAPITTTRAGIEVRISLAP
jgi:cell surface protein SprA